MMEKLPPVQWSEAWLMYYKNKMQRLEEQLPKGSCSSQFGSEQLQKFKEQYGVTPKEFKKMNE